MKIKLLSDWFLKSLNGAADIAAEISDFKTRGKIKCKAPAFAHQYIKNFVGTSLWQTVFTLESLPESGEAALLCFDSADFYAEVYSKANRSTGLPLPKFRTGTNLRRA